MSRKRAGDLVRPGEIRTVRSEEIPPDAKGSADFLARLGYKIGEALADLVDNSLDEKAKNILIRIVRTPDKIARVIIADDGEGMDDATLKEAMRFGGGDKDGDDRLGKYGVGLKSSSLSQAKTVIVLSRQGRSFCGRRWLKQNIAKGWLCDVLDRQQVEEYMLQDFAPVNLGRSGTIIVWEDLQHLRAAPGAIDATIKRTVGSVSSELGLRFHRFIGRKAVHIYMDAVEAGSPPSGIYTEIEALDPFSYEETGFEGYPKTFTIELPPYGSLDLRCHIWPPKSRDDGYRLGGGRVSARQGFYFYRNDRLIQAGGWNGTRDDESEPHLSLARVEINLPKGFDEAFPPDVTKSKLEQPATFSSAVLASTKGSYSFRQYIADAQKAYRKQKKKEAAQFLFRPGKGISSDAKASTKRLLKERGAEAPKKVAFVWKKLPPDMLVDFDSRRKTIYLNQTYRRDVLQGGSPSAADAPLIKLLLMFLLQDELAKSYKTERTIDWLRRVNGSLIATLQ